LPSRERQPVTQAIVPDRPGTDAELDEERRAPFGREGMHLPRRHGAIVRSVLIGGLIGLSGIASPASTLADSGVNGTDAVVANAQGDNVRVRAGASLDEGVVTKVPEGTALVIVDGPVADGEGNDWYRVEVNGATGFIVSDFVSTDEPDQEVDTPAAGSATATDNVHLRSGPSVAYLSIGKIPAGTTVVISGAGDGDWLRVTWDGFEGWAHRDFFTTEGATPSPAPAPVDEPNEEPAEDPVEETPETDAGDIGIIQPGTHYTTENVNLRNAPSSTSGVIEVVPGGVAIELTGATRDGYAQADYDGARGWVSLEYLSMDAPAAPTPEPEPAPEDDENLSDEPETGEPDAEVPAEPAPAGSTIIWPMSGGEWYIGQGYNGSSHQNNGSLWQYEYSFDLARTDENTGGQPTYSPVSGTVRWLDPSTGGISIDVGDGLAVALFHVDIDSSITEGDQLTQGEYIGTVSAPGGGGNGGWAHIHITAWATEDGGNWSREAIPFTGRAAISGQEFPSDGSSQDWTGTEINP
jgi:uncharacterized protein YraI